MFQFHKNLARRLFASLILVALVAANVLPALAQTRRTRRTPRLTRATRPVRNTSPAYYNVPAGQVVQVRMNEQISSETARIGDRFTTTTVIPIYVRGVEVIPAGSTITGRVTNVKRAQRKSKAGWIQVAFVSLQLPNGTTRAINGSLTALQNETATYDEEGQVTGRGSTKRNVVFIGGGAATGALIGAIAGGGKGAGIGAGIGAGLGVAGAYFSKGKEAVVKPGTEFGIILNQSVALPASTVR
ncbi:MAG: hypothetical protein ICV60_03295 [Pyrinomonadaceae bacterium]|nr:hypothetical protein [Pyrinomonadaceae bacterium]